MRCLLTEKLSCVTLAAPQPFADPSQEERLSWTQSKKDAFEETMKWMDKHLVNYVNGNDLVPRVPGNMDFVIGMLEDAPWMRVSLGFLPLPGLYTFQPADLAQQWKESCKQLKLYRPVGKTVYIGHASQSDLETPIRKDPGVVKISTMAGWYDAVAAFSDHQVTTYADRIHCKRAVKSHLFGHQSGIWYEKVLSDGTRFEGDFCGPNGRLRHGVKVLPDGTRYEGDWGPDWFRNAVQVDPDGTRYEGDWGPDGKFRHGARVDPNGTRWEGDWAPDGKFRHGVVVLPDGRRLEGDFRPDGKFRHGVVVFPSGQRAEGDWGPDGKLRGVIVLPDGTKLEGDWVPGPDGKFQGVKVKARRGLKILMDNHEGSTALAPGRAPLDSMCLTRWHEVFFLHRNMA